MGHILNALEGTSGGQEVQVSSRLIPSPSVGRVFLNLNSASLSSFSPTSSSFHQQDPDVTEREPEEYKNNSLYPQPLQPLSHSRMAGDTALLSALENDQAT